MVGCCQVFLQDVTYSELDSYNIVGIYLNVDLIYKYTRYGQDGPWICKILVLVTFEVI